MCCVLAVARRGASNIGCNEFALFKNTVKKNPKLLSAFSMIGSNFVYYCVNQPMSKVPSSLPLACLLWQSVLDAVPPTGREDKVLLQSSGSLVSVCCVRGN